MPTTVQILGSKFQLKHLKSLKWGAPVNENKNGIYIISTNHDKAFLPINEKITVNDEQIDLWLANAPILSLNEKNLTKNEIVNQLKGFWMPDEAILCIGKAEKQTFSERIGQFYNHKVGKKSPHKGGYWLKLLSNLKDLYLHLYETKESHLIEEKLLNHFMQNVSLSAKTGLIDINLCLLFANLQLRSVIAKQHGFKNHCQ